MYQIIVYNCVCLFPLAQSDNCLGRALFQLPQLSAMAFTAEFLAAHWAAFDKLEAELKEVKDLLRDLVAVKTRKAAYVCRDCPGRWSHSQVFDFAGLAE